MGVFVLLLLSGERNFGVRLNKPYTAAVPMDISVFSGSHADLLIIVFHKVSYKLHTKTFAILSVKTQHESSYVDGP